MRISDWSSDVCSSDLQRGELLQHPWVLLRQQAPFERRAVLVQRHQDLLAVRGKRVGVEEQVAGCGGGRGGWHGGSGASWGIHVIGVASIETLSGGDERAGPESTRVGTILRPASPACGLSLAGRSRHLAQYADVGGGVSLRRGLRRGIMIVPSGRIGMTYRLYYWPGIQGRDRKSTRLNSSH